MEYRPEARISCNWRIWVDIHSLLVIPVSCLVPALLAHLEHATDLYFDAVAQVRVGCWSRGRTALLGDAGYCGSPLSGLGTSLADAITLKDY